jgi:hypothetical protein
MFHQTSPSGAAVVSTGIGAISGCNRAISGASFRMRGAIAASGPDDAPDGHPSCVFVFLNAEPPSRRERRAAENAEDASRDVSSV